MDPNAESFEHLNYFEAEVTFYKCKTIHTKAFYFIVLFYLIFFKEKCIL